MGRAQPAMRRSIVLPELADVLHLPAAGRLRFLFRRGIGSQIIFQSPAPDGSPVDFEFLAAQDFGGGKAVGKRRFSRKQFVQQGKHLGGPRFTAIAARTFGRPARDGAAGHGLKITAPKAIKITRADLQFSRALLSGDLIGAEAFEDIPDKRRGVAMNQLLILFFKRTLPPKSHLISSLFVGLRSAPASSKTRNQVVP